MTLPDTSGSILVSSRSMELFLMRAQTGNIIPIEDAQRASLRLGVERTQSEIE